MKLRPTNGRVLVTCEKTPEKIGSIYVPDASRKLPSEGRVLAIAKGVKSCKIGDRVLFEKFAAVQVTVKDVECVLLAENDVQGVWEK